MYSQIMGNKLNIKKISSVLSCHGCDLKRPGSGFCHDDEFMFNSGSRPKSSCSLSNQFVKAGVTRLKQTTPTPPSLNHQV